MWKVRRDKRFLKVQDKEVVYIVKDEVKLVENKMLYHYCGVETFLNIIRNHTLRLSDLCNSTDGLEMKSLLNVVKEKILKQYKDNSDFMDSIIYGMGMDEAFSFILDSLIFKMKGDTDQMLFGICLSEEADLLGQWREYANRGTGLAIGFEMEWFRKLCEKYNLFKFSKVSYGYNEENKSRVEKLATSIYQGILNAIEEGNVKSIIDSPYALDYKISINKKLIYLESIFIKNKEYQNEKEWRLILDDENTYKSYGDWIEYYNWKKDDNLEGMICKFIPNGMEFMVRNGKIIPYLDLKFDLDTSDIPIKKIVIGPNCKVGELDIYHLLEFFGFESDTIKIEKSQSSYRL